MPKLLLKSEAVVVFVGSLLLYTNLKGSWWLFIALLFLPDIAMLGYVFNKEIGSILYNIGHTYMLPACLIGLSIVLDSKLGVQIGLVWMVHIEMDRILGYGLKYPTAFQDTHLQRI